MAAAEAADARRSLLVDQEEFEEQFLRCTVCREKYDQANHSPKSLPCNHTFCQECLVQVFDHHVQQTREAIPWADNYVEGVLKCPTCRVEVYIHRNEIDNLPPDHRVIQMIDFLTRTTAKTQNTCIKHESQALNFFCKKCLVPVCRDCTVLDHKESDEHVIVDVTEGLTEFSAGFDDIETKVNSVLEKLRKRTDGLANASKRLDLVELELRNKIKDTFIEYRLLLEKRQMGLIRIVKESIDEQKKRINASFMTVCTEGSGIQKLSDEFKKARVSNDVKQLFVTHQKIKDEEPKFEDLVNISDDDLFVSCEFKNDSEIVFLSEISNLGEIREKKDVTLKETVPAHQLMLLEEEVQRSRFVNETFAGMLIQSDEEGEIINDDGDNNDDRSLADDLIERASAVATAERLAQRAAAAVSSLREERRRSHHRRERYRVARYPIRDIDPNGESY